jgi:group II intron reverse transcriptase/maturase
MEPPEGKTERTLGLATVSTKQGRIAELARRKPDDALTTLAHHMDIEWLHEAYRRTRKDGALGIDGVSAVDYEQNLAENLTKLLEKAKEGSYFAPPVRRKHIPKAGKPGDTRPIGIPCFEDKVLQRAVVMLLEPIYEVEFVDGSHGFRPKRSPHTALRALDDHLMAMHGGWLIELDIRKYFDTIDHRRLMDIVRQRVRDGVVLRLISKWLHAGVMEDGAVWYPEAGTPQGGVLSPLLANVFLHEVLDQWFEETVKPRLRGTGVFIRFADDAVMAFSEEDDALRVMAVLPKRFEKFGLTLHPEKTRILAFRRPPRYGSGSGGGAKLSPRSFDFLGFTHYWARSRKDTWIIKRHTAKDRLSRKLREISDWCRNARHEPLKKQFAMLARKLRGHYAYFAVTFNMEYLRLFRDRVISIWRKWLGRRSQRAVYSWEHFERLERRYRLPFPTILHWWWTTK